MKKQEDISTLIKYRLEQAQTALDDGRFLLDGGSGTEAPVLRTWRRCPSGIFAGRCMIWGISKIRNPGRTFMGR